MYDRDFPKRLISTIELLIFLSANELSIRQFKIFFQKQTEIFEIFQKSLFLCIRNNYIRGIVFYMLYRKSFIFPAQILPKLFVLSFY